jgi:nucleoside-diphosphate-sugar epimerase
MRVFVTGATGFVGSAVVQELLQAGHQVIGLVRSDASAKALAATGAAVHRGDLEDLDSLRRGVAASDGVIHTAFIHDFSKFAENCEIDRRAIEAMGAELTGSKRPLIVTSGTGILATSSLATEDTPIPSGQHVIPRVASEQAAEVLMSQGLNVSVVRLPPSVHGDGDHAFVPLLIGLAREKGVAAYIGDGQNVWPAVHRLDAASLYRLALEKATPRVRYHGVGEEGIPFKDITAIIGRRLNIPVQSKTPEQAKEHFGWFAHFAGLNAPASSKLTQERLGWRPKQIGLITDLERGKYFGA